MSEERVELVRQCFDALAEGDIERMFALSVLDPEIEWDLSRRQIDAGVYRGLEGLRRYQQEQREAWSDHRVEPQEYIDAGDIIIVPVRVVKKGRSSGVEAAARAAWVFEFRDGTVVRATGYHSKAVALAAVGLRE